MAGTFKCKELDLKGQVNEVFYKAESKEEVIQLVRAKGNSPLKITQEEESSKDLSEVKFFEPKVKLKDIAIFCKQLSTMLAAGMPLLNSLEVLISQSDNATLKKTIKEVATQVQKGDVLSVAMGRYQKVFPVLLIRMIEAGEMTGNLDGVLIRMTEHYTKENKINSKIKGAMIYPMVLGILVVVVVVFLLTFVMPTFINMFVSSGVKLPLPTRILLGFSDAIRQFWYLFIAGFALVSFGMRSLLKTTEGKRAFDRLKLKMPMIKVNIAKIATSRFTRTLSTLLGSGIPIIQALDSAARVTNNMVVIDGIEKVSEDIKKGVKLSLLLKEIGVFPPMMISMVNIGEESGALEDMLEKTADYYDEELDSAIQKMIAIIEPVMIIGMALIVGFIVISMMLPMFDMFKTIG
ncbi:type II secretion system F family protein [Fusibacter ferrireducens]|uniref:Type II secretion system F family protein n=1 Tax=Fusibacter ferrireducens TaxID=2785058 RepID=A0ABR9ZTS2_9FIRM|nr:type II secretion system F family protein [Fusibacter ferrireducens]MBF4693852.1 type II secretion system F family protein [Fusibacter ferrireducens]